MPESSIKAWFEPKKGISGYWMQANVMLIMKLRTGAKNEFEKDLFKVMNNLWTTFKPINKLMTMDTDRENQDHDEQTSVP